ncbi:bifunctional UDP-N-acetylglucosamine diphosphorylase/glucosamine-1-phosphate N-acetyltransferase GlmU [Actinospica durhamensis]|uniref:Bifunctional protein GlmU n=1 Tax=Actinospica durhamensis TaxID=1508375 RepID=A0A941EK49_9ACTN|nr:bifunctional UDP-N-acetylglucosamine diphosphorylase/glucosamine-1-phosphate N-acetyltransferase GlmU [Actinospica durhamensis]MBR7831997.1 bifunctional UDP-N-acetylglucosamine diphosphorylase/glucosamine-1-phosphate N-acetyltransferase GlmU [Actinospica durhamensis]
MPTENRPAAVIVLAAGGGTRMKSATPKVLHELCGRPLVGHVVAAARELGPQELAVVIGHGREQVAAYLEAADPAARAVVQDQQLGTGHATRVAMEALAAQRELDGTVLVVTGDAPLLTAGTLRALLAAHQDAGRAVTVLSAIVPDPAGYGRIVREDGAVVAIVEQRDTDAAQAEITEINSGLFAFDAKVLREALGRVGRENSQGEEYLTDVLGLAVADGLAVGAYVVEDWHETLGVNDRVQLAEMRRLLSRRINEAWMREGVSIIDPASTFIDVQVELERDVVVHPNTQLHGATVIREGAEIGPNCTLTDTSVGTGAVVTNTTSEGAEIGQDATVGPYTYLRPGTRLGAGSKAGGFVEMKNAVLGQGSKVPHLSYVGDARIGVNCNLGAGTITANYDGVSKHRTEIGDFVFVGSNSVLIAPAKIEDGAFVAAGSAVNAPVGPGELAVARSRQRNISGYIERKRPGSPAAHAAARAREADEAMAEEGD